MEFKGIALNRFGEGGVAVENSEGLWKVD